MTVPDTFQPVPSGPLPEYVRAGETLLWKGKPSLALLVSQTIALLGTVVIFGGFFIMQFVNDQNPVFAALPGLILVGFVVLGVINGLRIRRTEYTVTTQSIYTRSGLIGTTIIQTSFDKITDISLKQDVLGRLLGFSALHVNTAGSGTPPVRMDGLRNALDVKRMIEATREGYLRRPSPATPPPAPRRVQRFIPDRFLLRVNCPTTKKPFKVRREQAGTNARCPHCLKEHLVKAPEAPRGRARPS